MRNATELMVQYAAYHRDRRNIASHCVGVPLIVFALGVLLGWPVFILAGLPLTPSWLGWALATLWYLSRGSLVLGLAVSVVNALLVWLAMPLAAGSTATWLGWGLAAFVLGWLIQLLGHYYEGRRPAFLEDRIGLLVGPMFVTAELLFALGWGKPMAAEIERRAGPTVLYDLIQRAMH
ncbi:DUF962 domain-containing protein [Crenobacter sp. SG2303]|uniref:DUF962 domain-containing protein n=1 Tax=Crenobacter oryzisoli TaxID=3056844 RepID=A0ABT7XPE1_9NEIS|nr:Mpo1-like protein [Crenobacter sp. SG2303]MDN0075657.1 DUF962 domain-containing protein [Crenobacter sp. SG2303]